MFQGELPKTISRGVLREIRRRLGLRDELSPGIIDAAIAALSVYGWSALVRPVSEALTSAANKAGTKSLWRLGIAEGEPEARTAQQAARLWARRRAAEMVGMRRNAAGQLVPNPNAEMAITESTRAMIRGLVEQAVESDWSTRRLADELKQAHAFSAARAETIARTESAAAVNRGQLIAFQSSGLVSGIRWITKRDNRVEPHCRENESAGMIDFGLKFPSGHMHPPAHPNCRCRLAAVVA